MRTHLWGWENWEEALIEHALLEPARAHNVLKQAVRAPVGTRARHWKRRQHLALREVGVDDALQAVDVLREVVRARGHLVVGPSVDRDVERAVDDHARMLKGEVGHRGRR